MRILTVPQDTAILRTKSEPIKTIDAKLQSFLKDLGETLKNQRDPQGVGLSAIQVGRPIRVFATLLPPHPSFPSQPPQLTFYLNPEILDHSKELTLGEDLTAPSSPTPYSLNPKPFLEGCLSIPSIYGPVPRWDRIEAQAVVLGESDLFSSSLSLVACRLSLEKLAARVFQHELDHLNGILFTDRTLEAGLQLYRQKEKELVEMEM